MSGKMRTLNVIYNKSNHFGLEKDYEFIRHAFSRAGYQIQSVDPHEPPKIADINIHLEIPVYANVPWASVNIFLMNPEYYVPEAFNGYLHGFDAVVVRDKASYELLQDKIGPKLRYMPFASMAAVQDEVKVGLGIAPQWLYVVGGSKNKIAAAKKLLRVMHEDDNKVLIICSKPEELGVVPANCTVRSNIDGQELARLQRTHGGHIILSEAEAFSHAAAEARAAGALQFSTQLPAITEYADDGMYSWVSFAEVAPNGYYHQAVLDDDEMLRGGWVAAQDRLKNVNVSDRRSAIKAERESAAAAVEAWATWAKTLKAAIALKQQLPPVLLPADCPPISIVTPTYNRRKLIDIAFHNLLWSDYPIEKIEWVVVEDSDDDALSSSDKIVQFGEHAKGLQLRYIPLQSKRTIGEKRNIGCEAAKNEIIVFMDDDDHYPPTSLRRRVAWLTNSLQGASAVGCTMLAMYDLLKGTSAVNVPPWGLPLGARVSEASLAFKKSFWEARKFSDVGIAEAELWLTGRESEFLEIPPQQLIVAFSHGGNCSSRKIPADTKPSCFWGFPPDYLKFIHGLAGMKVELNTKQ
jgi:hypothetical protein